MALRMPRSVVAAAALGLLALGLAVWATGLRQENERLTTQLRLARRGARPAVPPPPGTSSPDALKKENDRLRRQLEQVTVPQVNVPIVGLSIGAPRPTGLTAGATVMLVVSPPAAGGRDEYRLRVLAYDGSVVWEGAGLKRGPGGAISVVWPGSLAQPGRYRLELFGPAQSDRRLATFLLDVRPDEGAGG
jgi:hypothetical protein